MIKFGNKIKDISLSNQFDIFGESSENSIQAPVPEDVNPWTTMDLLSKEKEVVGIYISGHPLDDYKTEIDNFCNGHLGMLYNMDAVRNKELRCSVVVTDVEHKETKTGKPYGILHAEDYQGAYSFYLFSDDYIDYKSYFTIGWLLQITGRVKKKFYNDDLEFKISSVVLLSELIDKETRDVFLTVDLIDVSELFIKELTNIIESHKGKHSIIINVIDHLNKYDVNLLSRKNKVNLNKSFIQQIASLNCLQLKIK
jgi:DNA polymerase-3 subunit alpha